ncbi:hypothetical protein Ocin01_07883 [Orchesella cincta]|uniref:Uncharacterized protein n=1 Tax=Orchesella cincta TaxID=48709 RepID=A0A1D2N0R2_ORCCI|nr:hypothetical protein Ocin01_07883 [Orchesella cincta]
MYKLLAIFLAIVAVAVAAPQILLASSLGHIPYSNGWTDGPNNGVGPVVYGIPHLGVSHLGVQQLIL